ncbi:fimbria/pilus outer membrane usher protein [Citrobacter sp. JGM124]|uniref:fimbria/pilus outer membrane usher protein n=1 Tax=Citrobacter sp. JGM124 TaxID=2799789 RepID=UPI001BABC3A1|nr:fimbria/pilus outer membrane usher protein [Citrobacter sp. JGM124]MBS0847811.1 fimbrial biogenesis outer membrane usher protein [Citrobacter sp. JGM124]
MLIRKNHFLLILCLHVTHSYAKDYFNPLFLGADVDSIGDLSYLSAGNNVTPGVYFLSLNVGDAFIKNINVRFKENKEKKITACFTKEIIDQIPFNKEALNKLDALSQHDQCIDINDAINDFSYSIDLSKLALTLLIPQIYLKSVRSTLANESDWDDGITALMTNYNINGSYSKNKDMDHYTSTFISLNNRLNIGPWRFNSSSYYNQSNMGNVSTQEFNSNSIFVTRDINTIKSTLTVGQNVLGSILFDSNPYIGISLATSNEMLPESEKGYSPTIKGIVDSRSRITIRQNGNILYQEYINPGPYSIDNLNSVGTSGDYEVELTSDEGVVTKYTVPYSSLPNLLRQGSYNYSVSLGQLDISGADKSHFAQGSLGYGLPYDTTLYSGYQLANDYLALGMGLGKDIGNVGALSFDMIESKAKIDNKSYVGNSYRILFAKSFSNTGTNIQLTGYRYSTSNYYTFSEASYRNNSKNDSNDVSTILRNEHRKNSYQVNISQNMSNYGQLYLWGNVNTYWGSDSKSQNIQLGWNKTFTQLNNVMLSVSYNKNKYRQMTDDMFYFSISMPLSNGMDKNRMYLTNSTSYNNSTYNNTTSMYGNALDNKLGYNIYQTVSNNNQNRSNLNLNYKANAATVSAGTAFSNNSTELDYGLTGSVLVHQGGILFSRQANDTAILVEAKGAPGAKIDRAGENIEINNSGYALIPYATAYHYNDVSLSPETFGAGYDIDGKVFKVSPTRGAISKVIFDVRKGYNFLVALKYKNKPVKFGAVVTNNTEDTTSIINDDSTVYLTGVLSGSSYTVRINKDTICRFSVNYDDKNNMKSINNANLDCK